MRTALAAMAVSNIISAAPAFAGTITLVGRVSDRAGHPVTGATVVVDDGSGHQQSTTTDSAGRYRLSVAGGVTYEVVFAFGDAHLASKLHVGTANTSTVDATLDGHGEVIVIHDTFHDTVTAKPVKDPRILPPYSDEAVLSDTWNKAWLFLDVSETGTVQRVKFLKRPGRDLDAIAVRQAFKTRFQPARDRDDRPVRSYVVWPIEWPSYGWMNALFGVVTRMPDWDPTTFANGDALDPRWPPCLGSGPLHLGSVDPVYRDCAKPDLSKADASEPWIAASTRTR